MKKHVHFMGIAGSGASAIASIAEAEGFIVSGCDKHPYNDFTKHFNPNILSEGHSKEHILANWRTSELANWEEANNAIPSSINNSKNSLSLGRGQGEGYKNTKSSEKQDINEKNEETNSLIRQSANSLNSLPNVLAISPAITSLDPDNEELKAAKEKGIEILTWQEFMGKYLEQDKFVIAVCGTHGKSTTTAMIAHILEEANLDPTVELGAVVKKWGRNYRVSELANQRISELSSNSNSTNSPIHQSANSLPKPIFLTEADEFNNNFLVSHPDITVINNLDMDHPEFFKDFQDYTDSFEKFLLQNKGTIVANLEDKNVAEMMKWIRKHTNSECLDYSRHELELNLKVPGDYNKQNAKAAFQVGLLLGIEPQTIINALNSFTGIQRRQELLGTIKGAKVYTDYAVHPVEIEKTTNALKEANLGKNICIIFQPHMFSRTKGLFSEFVQTFQKLEIGGAFITDIFASREQDPGDMNTEMLVKAINKQTIKYMPLVEDAIKTAEHYISEKDIVIFYGAGDIDKVARNWVKG